MEGLLRNLVLQVVSSRLLTCWNMTPPSESSMPMSSELPIDLLPSPHLQRLKLTWFNPCGWCHKFSKNLMLQLKLAFLLPLNIPALAAFYTINWLDHSFLKIQILPFFLLYVNFALVCTALQDCWRQPHQRQWQKHPHRQQQKPIGAALEGHGEHL